MNCPIGQLQRIDSLILSDISASITNCLFNLLNFKSGLSSFLQSCHFQNISLSCFLLLCIAACSEKNKIAFHDIKRLLQEWPISYLLCKYSKTHETGHKLLKSLLLSFIKRYEVETCLDICENLSLHRHQIDRQKDDNLYREHFEVNFQLLLIYSLF